MSDLFIKHSQRHRIYCGIISICLWALGLANYIMTGTAESEQSIYWIGILFFSAIGLFFIAILVKLIIRNFAEKDYFDLILSLKFFDIFIFENGYRLVKKRYQVSDIKKMQVVYSSYIPFLVLELVNNEEVRINLKFSYVLPKQRKEFIKYVDSMSSQLR